MTRVRLAAVLSLTSLLAACGTDAPAAPAPIRVAFLVDLSSADALEHVLPARRGAELAFAIAQVTGSLDGTVELIDLDLAADPDVLTHIEADPTFVAVIVAPGTDDGASAGEGDMPTVSLSGLGVSPRQSTAWLRLVAPLDVLADTMADHVPSSSTCVLSDDPVPDDLGDLLAERIGGALSVIEPASADNVVERDGCTTVSWVGSPDAGVEVARALEGSVIAFTGGDRLLGPDFIDQAGLAAEGALSTCSCADVSRSLDLDVQRFIQDYQARFGSAPGAYAVEGWDAANLLVRALREGEPTVDSVRGFLGSVASEEGLERVYRFTSEGELVDPASYALTYLALGGRWTPVVRSP